MAGGDLSWLKNISFPTVIEKVKAQGVLTPLLWLCGLSYVATAISAFSQSPVVWGFLALSCVTTWKALVNFDHFRDKDPRLLQSESFQLAHQKAVLSYEQKMESKLIEQQPSGNSRAKHIDEGQDDE